MLKDRVGCSLQTCCENAIERNELERVRHKESLRALVNNVAELIFVDDMRKDRNSERIRRAWDIRNSRGISMSRWFQLNMRCNLIAAMDINELVPVTRHTVRRDQISEEGVASAVDSVHFEGWMENCLVLTLGRHELGERRSIVVVDNVSTHTSDRVRQLTNGAGACPLCTTPCSPDLNPIELAFSNCKSSLKRNYELGEIDWCQAHLNAIDSVNRGVCIKEHRRCGVHPSNDLLTSEEEEEEEKRKMNHFCFYVCALMQSL